ncbi:hypothetical protein FIBSPDRAFT_953038 [Athelia psychrophila]|uniref:Uncharacterized protein n=1 Tax=Athelia psychrophila TaxID=1759441 RepID=A0A166KRM9_9AGAM|nr:hypothetical protein FIBSPDRAFT_953038 [Fibularhizoctonia sp. CBS 109695]
MTKHDPTDDISCVDVDLPSSYAAVDIRQLRDLDKFCPQNCQGLLVTNGSAPLNSDLDAYMPCRSFMRRLLPPHYHQFLIEERFWAKLITRLQRSTFLSPFSPWHRYGRIYNTDQWRPLAAETIPFPILLEEPWEQERFTCIGRGTTTYLSNAANRLGCYFCSSDIFQLASYWRDLVGSLVHYRRALCVLQPYDDAFSGAFKKKGGRI